MSADLQCIAVVLFAVLAALMASNQYSCCSPLVVARSKWLHLRRYLSSSSGSPPPSIVGLRSPLGAWSVEGDKGDGCMIVHQKAPVYPLSVGDLQQLCD